MSRRGDRSQQTVDAHANSEPIAERLDVNVARAQFDRPFDEVVDRAHDRRAAREVAQIVDVVPPPASRTRPPAAVASSKLSLSPSTVAMSSKEAVTSSNGAPSHFHRLKRRRVGGIARGQRERSIFRLEWE